MRRRNRSGLVIAVALAIASPAPGLGRTIDVRQNSMTGTGGADIIRGDATKDRLAGKSGNDRLYGRGGSDRLGGGAGNDALYGGAGADVLFGGPGADILSGGPGGDRLNGGPGNDRIAGGPGNDRISALGMGRDRVRCGSGQDTVLADSRDRLSGCETVRRRGLDKTDPCNGVPACGLGSQDLGPSFPVGDGSSALLPPVGSDPASPPDPPTPTPSTRPNIVFILTDDQPYDTVTPKFMPNVWSSLVEPGLTFTNAFVTRSLCCPSRASILTGQYAHNTGVHGINGFPDFNDASTAATWLKDAGYRTGLIGKYLNAYGLATGYGGKPTGGLYVPPGWDTFRAFNDPFGNGYYNYNLNIDGREKRTYMRYTHEDPQNPTIHPENYTTTVLAKHALEFIDASAQDRRPFFLYLAPNAPHAPYTPADEDRQAFPGLPARRPPSFNEDDVSDKPEWLRTTKKLDEWSNVDAWRLLQLRTNLAVDRAVGDIVDRLRELGELDSTLIVFTSDNGLMWGEHRKMDKFAAYEESIRVPLIVRGPGVRQGTASPMVANIDFAPTIAELAQATPTLTIDGRSLTPLLAGVPAGWRDDLLVEHWLEGVGTPGSPPIPTFKSLRTEDHKYVEYDTDERELYDLRSDPYELQNIAGDSAQTDLVQRLSIRLTSLKTCAGETCRTDADQSGQ